MGKNTILIIGGMGPQASISLHERLIKRAFDLGARHGSDFPKIIHVSLPIEDFISSSKNRQKALIQINQTIRDTKKTEKDFFVIIACNTAHVLLEEMDESNMKNVISLIDSTLESNKLKGVVKVGVLASPETIRSQLFNNDRCEIMVLNHSGQMETEAIIRKVIAGEIVDRSILQKLVNSLISKGADKVILGCTELSAINHRQKLNRIIDPIEEVVKVTMDRI